MGANVCYVYGERSINRLEYYPFASTVFNCVNIVPHQGSVNDASIVSTGDAHYFFNANYGFVKFRGLPTFPDGGHPISEPIEDMIRDIPEADQDLIYGTFIPLTNEICWNLPTGYLVWYNVGTGQWRRNNWGVARIVQYWKTADSYTWTNLSADEGPAWEDVSQGTRWRDLYRYMDTTVFSGTTGHTWQIAGESIVGWDDVGALRVEPVMHFGHPNRKKYLLEIWLGLATVVDTTKRVSVQVRCGDTLGELEGANWTSTPGVSLNSPNEPKVDIPNTLPASRFWQARLWLSSKSVWYSVNEIDYVYVMEGPY
jgi:hypothetical protein